MKSGSIVGLIKPLSDNDTAILIRNGIKKWPVVDQTYEVDFLRPPLWLDIKRNKVCIVLLEFPEFEVHKVDMDADMFIELLPPLDMAIVIEEPYEELA